MSLPNEQPGSRHLMIRSADIKHFRCFKSIKLEDCRRVNIVVGENGSGKTALLEAFLLALGPGPDIALRLRQWRGYQGSFSGSQRDIADAIWRDLFHSFDKSKPISISLLGSWQHTIRQYFVCSGRIKDSFGRRIFLRHITTNLCDF